MNGGFNPCHAYGHKWQNDPNESAKLPAGYVMQKCRWCNKKQAVMMR
jgi:hypothetical protein